MTFLGDRPFAAWLAMCFGACLRPNYTAVPNKELREPGKKAAPPPPKQPTTNWREIPLVSKFELIKQIGKGGFSEIWLAHRRGGDGAGGGTSSGTGSGGTGAGAGDGGGGWHRHNHNSVVALKVVQLANADLEPEEVSTLLAEAKFLRTLDCPYLLRCYETAATEDWLVLVLEYLSGGEIMDHLHKVKKYTEAEAAKLFAQVVSAISYLHNLNIIHRDIKPENLMFDAPVEECEAQGRPLRVKVIDLGMAAMYDPKKPICGCVGTPGFVSPEVWHDGPHTPACDIYALGVVLFIMLTGRKPHSGADIRLMTYCNKSIREAPGLSDERFLSLSSAARELLLSMLADDPSARPSCMAVLRHPFITAVDSNKEAHREMEVSVRRRMRELAQLRRVHGLRYALRVQKPQGADHLAFLQAFDQRRLKLKGESGGFARVSGINGPPALGRPSYADSPFGRPSSADVGGGGGGVPAFARSSLAVSYATPPPVLMMASVRSGGGTPHTPFGMTPAVTATTSGISVPSSSAAATAGGTAVPTTQHLGPGGGAAAAASPSPFSRLSVGSSATQGPLLKPTSEPSLPPPRPAAVALPSTPLPDIRCGSTPDARSRDMGVPVQDSLAARPPARIASATPTAGGGGGSAANSGRASQFGSRMQAAIDPMAIVNALPTLQHCQSADAVTFGRLSAMPLGRGGGTGSGGGDDVEADELPPDGGSPVERALLAEQALLNRCMSANPDTLELLGRQESLRRFLAEAADAMEPQSRSELRALAAAVYPQEQQPEQEQPER